jgi:hypothetical protein
MPVLSQGSRGAEVAALQTRLIQLGFLAGSADADFGPLTAQAVRDLQRRLLLRPDGIVGPRTTAALAAAVARQPAAPLSVHRQLVQQAEALAARGLAHEEKLPILDQGLASSPFRSEPPLYAARLEARPPAQRQQPYPDPHGTFMPYPAHGVVPAMVSGCHGRGGLEFLSEEVSQACLCIGSHGADQPLRVRWYGRRALEDTVQFWSATKFIAPLHLVCQVNRRSPGTPIAATVVRPRDGSPPLPFAALFRALIDYAPPRQAQEGGPEACHGSGSDPGSAGLDHDPGEDGGDEEGADEDGADEEGGDDGSAGDGDGGGASGGEDDGGSSNRIGYLFKRLLQDGEPDVQTWMRRLTGNPQAQLLGWYGQWRSARHRWHAGAELVGPDGVLLGHRALPRTRNLVSAYDLVRVLSMLGWHRQLPPDARLPGAHWSSLRTLVEGLGHDPARYLDRALQELDLTRVVREPVILSKLGYGAETGDAGIDALTYVAFASFRDTRTTPARQRCFALALRIPTAQGLSTALRHDARMAAEVTEIVRRIFNEEFR